MSSIRKQKKKKADQKGWILLAIAFCIIYTLGYFFIEAKRNYIARDTESSCREDGVISRDTAIVIDTTDSFSDSQAMLIKKEIESMLADSLLDERYSLYVLNENVNNKSNIVIACNAGDGSDASEYTSNKRKLKQKWEEKFYFKFVNAVEALINEHTVRQSPIFEMIKHVSINTMYASTAPQKRIILVSDMLHHTKLYSQYKNSLNFIKFNKTPYSLEARPYLTDVDVEILYLVRSKDIQLQNHGHIEFWESFLTNAGGQLQRVKSIN